MNIIESVYASGQIVHLILVPVVREIAAVLLAIAISKDCAARDNGSGVLWGLFTLFMPAFSGIIYFIYSRLLLKRGAKTPEDNKKIKASRRLAVSAVLIYIVSLIIALIAIITSFASSIALNLGEISF